MRDYHIEQQKLSMAMQRGGQGISKAVYIAPSSHHMRNLALMLPVAVQAG